MFNGLSGLPSLIYTPHLPNKLLQLIAFLVQTFSNFEQPVPVRLKALVDDGNHYKQHISFVLGSIFISIFTFTKL
jgi:hypothetical protein